MMVVMMKQKYYLNLKKLDLNVKSKTKKVKQEAVHKSHFIVTAWNATVPHSDAKLEQG